MKNYDDAPSREPIRKSTKPVNTRHDVQRRAENAINRSKKKNHTQKSNKRG